MEHMMETHFPEMLEYEASEETSVSMSRVSAFADNVAILISGQFLQTIIEIMESVLKALTEWAKGSSLTVNPTKGDIR